MTELEKETRDGQAPCVTPSERKCWEGSFGEYGISKKQADAVLDLTAGQLKMACRICMRQILTDRAKILAEENLSNAEIESLTEEDYDAIAALFEENHDWDPEINDKWMQVMDDYVHAKVFRKENEDGK